MSGARLAAWVRDRGRGPVVLRTAAVSVASRGLSLVGSLATVPIALHALGPEQFGVWMAALALSTLFALADGGVANGMVSPVSEAVGRSDYARVRTLIAAGFVTSTAFLLAFMPLVLAAALLVDWRWAFNLSSASLGGQAALVVVILSACFALATPPSVVRQARLGLLQGDAVSLWDLGGLVLSFMGIIGALTLHLSLPLVALGWAAPPVLMRTLAALSYLAGRGRRFLPTLADFDLGACKTLLASGGVFMAMNLTQGLAVQSDQVLIARLINASAVTDYSVVQRLFNQPCIIATLVLAAQWPAYGQALGRGDRDWIRAQLRRTLLWGGLASAVACAVLALLCQPIIDLWVGPGLKIEPRLIAAMAVFGVVATLTNIFMFFFLSMRLHRRILASQALMTVLNLGLTIFLIPRLGVAGAIIGTTVGYLAAILAPSLLAMGPILESLPGPDRPAPGLVGSAAQ